MVAMIDLIIPATDTPGAKGARVNEFIDVILTEWATDSERQAFLDGLAGVDKQSNELFGKNFTDASPAQQTALLRAMDNIAMATHGAARARHGNTVPEDRDKQLRRQFLVRLQGHHSSRLLHFGNWFHPGTEPANYSGRLPWLRSADREKGIRENRMPANTYDAIIVGSGITGGWAAKELTEKGLNTLVLEAGRTIVPEQDYVEHVPVWELKYRGWDDRAERERTQPIQRECYYACDEYSHKFFVSDVDNPYSLLRARSFRGFAAGKSAESPHLGAAELSLERSRF